MGILEDELKKRFSDKSEEGSVDSEALWGGISESLDMGQATRPGAYWNWARIGGIALLIGGIGAFIVLGDDASNIESVQGQESIEQIESVQTDAKEPVPMEAMDPETGHKQKGSLTESPEVAQSTSSSHQSSELEANTSQHTLARSAEKNPLHDNGSSGDEDGNSIRKSEGSISSPSDIESIASVSNGIDMQVVSSTTILSADKLSGSTATSIGHNLEDTAIRSEVQRVSLANAQEVPEDRFMQKAEGLEYESRDMQDGSLLLLKPQDIAEIVTADVNPRELAISIPELQDFAPTADHYSKRNFAPTELSVELGAELMQLDFDTKGSTPDLNEFTRNIPGYSASVLASWVSNRGFRLSVGIAYTRLRSKFDYYSQEEIQYLDEDRLITYELDQVTGDTLNPVYQDTWLDATETRTIIHHNEFDLLSMPLSIGYERDFGKVSLGIDAGLSYGFFLNQKGRSIDAEGAITTFDSNAGTKTPFKSSLLSYSLTPIIDYRLSDAMSIRLAPQVRLAPKTESDFHGVDQSAMILGLSGGIVYQLK